MMKNIRYNTAREGKSSRRKRYPGSRRTAALAGMCAATVLLAACGNQEYLKDIKAANYVTLGNYIGIEATANAPAVDDNLVDMYITREILPSLATKEEVRGGAVEEGDTVNIDYAGYIDGEAFDGGTAAGASLTIGSHQFIDGFEDGLIGAGIGEKVTLDLSFPDPYQPNPDLSGVPVVFEVTVNGISRQVLPELTDELVQSLQMEGVRNEKELREYLYNYFYESAALAYETTIEDILTDTVMSDCTFREPPARMVDRFLKNIKDGMNAQAAVQGMTLVDYMKQYYGMSVEEYEERFRADALTAAQQFIMFQAIADAEGLNPTAQQLQEEIDSRVQAYHYESEKAYRESTDVEMLREQLMKKNVMAFLKENGDIKATSVTED